jgi:hypothetical protein
LREKDSLLSATIALPTFSIYLSPIELNRDFDGGAIAVFVFCLSTRKPSRPVDAVLQDIIPSVPELTFRSTRNQRGNFVPLLATVYLYAPFSFLTSSSIHAHVCPVVWLLLCFKSFCHLP